MVADFGMRHIHPAIELSVENDSAADARTHGDVNQSRFQFPRSPARFAQRRSVGIIFERDRHLEFAHQVLHRIISLPSRQ